MGVYAHQIARSMSIKLLGAMTELMIPYILGHHRTIVSAAFAQSFAPSVQG